MTTISTQYAMAAIASSLFIYTLLKLVYRIFFHPLRRFPGPTLAACTKYYRGYYDIVQNGGWLEQLEKLHRLYGPVVRVAPNQLDFSGSKAYDDIISKPYPKDHEYYEVLGKPNADALVTTCDPKEASGRRLAIGAYLSRKAVFRLEHDVEEKVDTLVHRLSSHVGSEQPVDLTYAFRAASLDIITSYLFAQRFNSLDYPNFQHPMILSLEKVTQNIWFPKYIPISFDKLPEWIVRKLVPAAIPMLDQQKHLNRQFFELVQSDAADEPKQAPAIFDAFLCKGSEGKKTWTIPRARLLDECTSLQVAGTDTVANACTIGTYHLLRNPQILVNLQRELDQTWPDRDSPMNLEQLEKLPYLTSVIKESLRLSHGVVDPLPHVVNRPDATVMGIPVPIGTTVSSSCYFVHTDPSVFIEPARFRPERWLDPADARDLDKHLVSFAKGPRMCLGVNLAWCELYLLFGHIFRKLELETTITREKDIRFRDHFVPSYPGRHLYANVKLRN